MWDWAGRLGDLVCNKGVRVAALYTPGAERTN